MPFFSIITVCYNSKKTIEKTLQSVLSQTEQDFEYILIDGASTDGTLDILRAWEPKFGGRMKLVSEPDAGIYDAMNKGIRMARGTLVGIVNSDDFYQSDALERVKAHYDPSLRYQILYGAQNNIDDDGDITTVEFVAGCIVNLRLHWQVWDYSSLPFNLLGQICPRFILMWFALSIPGVALCTLLHRLFTAVK